ncbi:MAG: hypothetical protein WD066_20255 [Planctomycetaceae bacterium]
MAGIHRLAAFAARTAASAAIVLSGGSALVAQDWHRDPHGMYQPLNQSAPPGRTALWYAGAGRIHPVEQQTVRVALPSTGKATIFTAEPAEPVVVEAPGIVTLNLAHVYRLRIAEMPEFPGVELYPSIELVDRLHPPQGQENRFPLPVEFHEEEIEAALAGNLVTKVVYLEQPQLARIEGEEPSIPVADVPNAINLFAAADLRGRPLAIIRLGSRVPEGPGMGPGGNAAAFFGTGRQVLAP